MTWLAPASSHAPKAFSGCDAATDLEAAGVGSQGGPRGVFIARPQQDDVTAAQPVAAVQARRSRRRIGPRCGW